MRDLSRVVKKAVGFFIALPAPFPGCYANGLQNQFLIPRKSRRIGKICLPSFRVNQMISAGIKKNGRKLGPINEKTTHC